MEVDGDDDVLRGLAQGGKPDYEEWPSLLTRLLARLEKIVNEDFPKPTVREQQTTIPSSQVTTQDLTSSSPSQPSTQSSAANKENAPPSNNSAAFPKEILDLINSINKTLTSLFSNHPPHTIQRLAELLLNPKQHYRSLGTYLHALDRVVHVSSGAHTFPLPPAIPDPSSAHVLSNGILASGADPLSVSWGNPASSPQSGLGSDDSLGGALLTPISWLTKSTNGSHSPSHGEVTTESTEMVDGPNGPGGVETVSVSVNGISSPRDSKDLSPSTENTVTSLRAEGGVTQGELLRQEQRAGVVPAAQLHSHLGTGDGEEEELPHARGPDEIGAEDIGTQHEGSTTQRGGPGLITQGINIEAAIGRRIEVHREAEGEKEGDSSEEEGSRTPKREAEEEEGGDEKRVKDEGGDTDIVLADVDGRTEDEPKVGEKGENRGADAIDTSAVP